MSNQDISKFIHIEGGRNLPTGGFVRNEMMNISDIKDWRQKHNNEGLYLSAYLYDNVDVAEANLYGSFYLDFDAEEDFDKARQDAISVIWYLKQRFTYNIPESFIRIFFSGKKGIHIVIPANVFGIEPHKHLNEFYKLMALKMSEQTKNGTLDTRIYDRRRLFRIYNSLHPDTKLYKIPLTYFELTSLSVEEIKEKAKEPQPMRYEQTYEVNRAKAEYEKYMEEWKLRFEKKFSKKKNYETKPLDFVPHCIQELWASGPVKGQRNDSAAALTSFLKKQGLSEEEAWKNLVKWNRDSLSTRELEMVMKSIYHKNYEYGCARLETLATCVKEKCKLYRK